MKRTTRLAGTLMAVVGVSFLIVGNALAAGGYGGGARGGSSSGYSGGGHGSYSGGHGGGYQGGYSGGYRGGYYGGYHGGYSYGHHGGYSCGSRYYSYGNWWYPWSLSFSYVYSPPVYYYEPAPVVYSAPPPAAVVYSSSTPAPSYQAKTPVAPPVGVADVKALAQAGVGEDVMTSQIRSSRAVYHLTTAEIIEMKEAGVSEKVIDFMINTAAR